MWNKGVPLLLLLSTLGAMTQSAVAVSLRPGKATDISVCDLGPNTTSYLASKVLIPAVASSTDQESAYFRLAGDFVAKSCTDGQLLIAHGQARLPADVPSLTELANSACLVAEVVRTDGQGTDGRDTYATFELRCRIRKHGELREKLAQLEARDPIGSLLTRLAQAAQGQSGQGASSNAPRQKDCDKMSLTSLIRGGGCP